MGDGKIQEAIRILAGVNHRTPYSLLDCTVVSVDLATRTVQVQAVQGSAANVFTARLMPAVDDGLLYIPEIDSTVCVAQGGDTTPYVTMWSALSGIVLRGGEFAGLVKVIELTKKLNNLEKLINDLVSKFNDHTHIGVTSGGGVSGITTSQETGSLVVTKQSDIENTNIKHG